MRGATWSLLLLAACATARPTPVARDADLVALFSRALEREARDPEAALPALIELVEAAAGARGPVAEAALLAGLDALVLRSLDPIELGDRFAGLALRVPGGVAAATALFDRVYSRAGAVSVFAPAAVARARLALALVAGDEAAAATWRRRTGCVAEATVAGPLAWPPLTALRAPTSLEAPGARLLADYPVPGAFAGSGRVAPVVSPGCRIVVTAGDERDGVRAIAVDVDLPRAERIAVELEGTSPAVIVIGGQPAAVRGTDKGGSATRTRATALAGPGRVRVVARVAANGSGHEVRLALLGQDGRPLVARAPRPGDAAPGAARAAVAHGIGAVAADAVALAAAGELALGDARAAAYRIEAVGAGAPALALLYTRALTLGRHLPVEREPEVLRKAFASVLAAWPDAGEAVIGSAVLALRFRGQVEGRLQALGTVAAARARGRQPSGVIAWQAVTSARADLRDRAEAALAELAALVPGTPLVARVDRLVRGRVGAEREAVDCGSDLDRSGFHCFEARRARADWAGAGAELARLRRLWQQPTWFKREEIDLLLARGDTGSALALYDRMLPGERMIAQLGGLAARAPAEVRARLARDQASAWDGPAAALALGPALGDDPAAHLAGQTAALVARHRASGADPGAATLVLAHREWYEITATGVLRATIYDVRRVLGTTDVEGGARMSPETVDGTGERVVVRRRIFKPDGRVLDPDPIAASQAHAELSQLEPGDYLEEIVHGSWRPREGGRLLVYTPDLLRPRTSVVEARIELRRPAGLALPVWAHPRFGPPALTRDGAHEVATYRLPASPPRRHEDAVPWPEAQVRLAFATGGWEQVGQRLHEALASFADADPFVSRWARGLAGNDEAALIAAVVAEVGRVVKRAHPRAVLGMVQHARGVQRFSSRHILELGEGSRTLLAHRALTERGLRAEVVLAETSPFPVDPAHAAVVERFEHPLLRVPTRAGELWLDLDVDGPPLPPGRVSPDRRGRLALRPDGRIVPIGGIDPRPTEVELALTLDRDGTARGTVTIALRELTAQRLAEELARTVGLPRELRLRAVLQAWIPDASINQITLASAKASPELTITANIEVAGYGQRERDGWVLPGLTPVHQFYPYPDALTLAATYARERTRAEPLAIFWPQRYAFRRRVTLPAPARLVGSPPSHEESGPELEATRHLVLADDRTVDERFTLSLPTTIIPAAHYQRFRQALTRTDAAFSAATRVGRAARPTN